MKEQSAIRKMFYGEMGHHELIKMTKEQENLLDEVIKNDDAIREKLKISLDLLELYEKTNSSIEAMHSESVINYYVEGFKFGFLMGLDVANFDD